MKSLYPKECLNEPIMYLLSQKNGLKSYAQHTNSVELHFFKQSTNRFLKTEQFFQNLNTKETRFFCQKSRKNEFILISIVLEPSFPQKTT